MNPFSKPEAEAENEEAEALTEMQGQEGTESEGASSIQEEGNDKEDDVEMTEEEKAAQEADAIAATEQNEKENDQVSAPTQGLAQYRITGLVDKFDEQGSIVGQYPVDSIQELTEREGSRAVEAGQAEMVE